MTERAAVGRYPKPRKMVLNGVEVVLVHPELYEQLETHRRQIGASAKRIHTLKQQLKTAVELLDAVQDAVNALPESEDTRRVLLALLADRGDLLQRDSSPPGEPRSPVKRSR